VQAAVLVGGKGTRLRPLTRGTPKPLLPIIGRPLIAHLLDRLPARVDEVFLAVSYLAEAVERWADARADPALATRRVLVYEEDPPRGTAGALANLKEHVRGPLVVLNGDLVTDLDVSRLIATHETSGARATMALVEVDDPSRYGVAVVDEAGGVRRFLEKPAPGATPSRLVNAGAYVLEADVVQAITKNGVVMLEREVFPQLAAAGELAWHRHEGLWMDCGTPQSYLAANQALRRRSGRDVFKVGEAVIAQDAVVRESVLGRNVLVESGARVTGSVLLDGVRVRSGAEIMDGVVASRAEVGAMGRVMQAVLAPGERLPPGGVRVGMQSGSQG
jgi:mannose-1-phosphate guanylyltransferase